VPSLLVQELERHGCRGTPASPLRNPNPSGGLVAPFPLLPRDSLLLRNGGDEAMREEGSEVRSGDIAAASVSMKEAS
jgi:hypothetical protein